MSEQGLTLAELQRRVGALTLENWALHEALAQAQADAQPEPLKPKEQTS